MIAFTVPLTIKDWDDATGGWRCPALKIPGLEVRHLYVTGKVSEDWYSVDAEGERIVWHHGEPPKRAVLAVCAPDDLRTSADSRRDVDSAEQSSNFWKRLAIVVPIITALISTSAGWKFGKRGEAPLPAAAAPAAGQSCETWTVSGRAALADAGLSKDNVIGVMTPPSLRIQDNGGRFEWDIPVPLNGKQEPQFPTIQMWVQGTDRPFPSPPTIFLKGDSQRIDYQARTIVLNDLVFPKPPPTSYR